VARRRAVRARHPGRAWAGLALGLLAIGVLLFERWLSRRAAAAFDRTLTALDRRTAARARRSTAWVLAPLWFGHRDVERVKDIRYADDVGRRHLLDVYRPRPRSREPGGQRAGRGAPVLLQIHGGAWIVGTKSTQGRPLMQALAASGWVCVAINYRLSPRAAIADQLIDCKLALRWIREHAAEHGGDPDRVVVTGGSAGGHLAALVALTANDPQYQPGFEDVDTAVVGCVAMYGAYDLEEIFGGGSRIGRQLAGRMGAVVVGARLADEPAAYRAVSPIHAVAPGAPPFLVVHGTTDNLVPVAQARRLVAALRDVGTEVAYVELRGAPHAFDVFHSEWADAAVAGVVRWLSWLTAGLDAGASQGRSPRSGTAAAGSAATGPRTMARTAPS
jgi:acetyl esterase/lipase